MKLQTILTLIGLGLWGITPVAHATAPVQSINTGPIVSGGTYLNTSGSRTTFTNSSSGLWLQSGTTVQGLESSSSTTNGNGGTLYLTAPTNVVRIDGSIDVSALHNGTAYTANGGHVFVDSGYVYQNGAIYANGAPVSTVPASVVNTSHNGAVVPGGTYFNTADSKTTFTNTQGTGLWLQNGTNLRGLEVNAGGALTNNGGTFYFNAPNQVIRLDGNIDVRAVQSQCGAYLGSGGKVLVNSAYLYQNGYIYANGAQGGSVQFNVTAMASTNSSRIDTRDGAASFNNSGVTTGPVTLKLSALPDADGDSSVVRDSTGKLAGVVDTHVIALQGDIVNRSSYTVANAIEAQDGVVRILNKQSAPVITIADALLLH